MTTEGLLYWLLLAAAVGAATFSVDRLRRGRRALSDRLRELGDDKVIYRAPVRVKYRYQLGPGRVWGGQTESGLDLLIHEHSIELRPRLLLLSAVIGNAWLLEVGKTRAYRASGLTPLSRREWIVFPIDGDPKVVELAISSDSDMERAWSEIKAIGM